MKKINYLTSMFFLLFVLSMASCSQGKLQNDSQIIVLNNHWKLMPSEKLEGKTGKMISQNDFNTKDWYNAVVPGTVLGSLAANKVVEDPYFGINMKSVDKEQFKKPWWYRTSIKLSADDLNKSLSLRFKGINYRANLWINGKKVVGKDKFAGAFRMFTFKINDYVIEGENIIALETWQRADGEYSIGFVDWNPLPPDRNMGIFRDVLLEVNGGVKIRSPFVQAEVDKATLNAADLTICAELENNTAKDITGTLKVNFELGQLEKKISLKAGETLSCKFTPEEYGQLKVNNVKLWWPNGMGDPNLYNMHLAFIAGKHVVDQVSSRYGIREIESYLDENKNRAYKVNGKFVLIKGGGWVDDLLLQDTKETVKAQLDYVKHMNLNTIRLEGFWGKDDVLYDLCDEYGILIMVGWSCEWEWEEYLHKPVHPKYGGATSKEDVDLLAAYWKDQLLWLRGHASVFTWMLGSDKLPKPELEQKYVDLFNKYDNSRPYVTSAGGVGSDQSVIGDAELVSDLSGPTGMKMLGPYAYTPPVYWFTNTNLGGAYGFNTETCPGPNISPLSSLKRMMPADKIWPRNKEYWEFHSGRNVFTTLDRFVTAMDARYGKSTSIEDFAFKAQIMNYELMRPMFESFTANKPNSTGLIQWMLNSAWPEMYWQLYDSYLQPNGAFYAVRKAGNRVHAIYVYGKDKIYLANNHMEEAKNLNVKIKVYDINSKEIFAEEWKGDIAGNTSKKILDLAKPKKLSGVWFLDMHTYDENDNEIDNSFYWLSTKADELDYKAGEKLDWQYYTPSKAYADFSALSKLPKVKLSYDYKYEETKGTGNISLRVKNPSGSIAFFIYFDLVDSKTGKPILPIFWDDNYVSLLPGEERTFSGHFLLDDTKGGRPSIKVKAWNVGQVTLN